MTICHTLQPNLNLIQPRLRSASCTRSSMQGTPLNRSLTLSTLIFYGTGMILGAGIYSIIGSVAGLVGPSLWLSFLLAAVCSGLTALSYCELATLNPQAGAEYTYLKNAFPLRPCLATGIGLVMAVAGTTTASAVALSFGGYMSDFLPLSPVLSGIVLLVILSAINVIGVQESSRTNIVFTIIEVSGLFLFIVLGFSIPKFAVIIAEPVSPKILAGSALIIFAYFGFEDIANLVEETKDPEKTIPKAILWSLLISTVIYVLVSLSAISIAPIENLVSGKAPLMDATATVSPKAAFVLGICALFSTANTVLIAMLAASRSFFAMAAEGSIPAMFAMVLPNRRTPWLASLLVLALALSLMPLDNVEFVASLSSFATLIGFFTVNVSLIVLRYRAPHQTRAFRVPFSIGRFPILPALGAIAILLLMFQFSNFLFIR